MPSGVPSDTWLLECIKGDLMGIIIFGFSIWGSETIGDGGGMGDEGNCEGGGVYGICCCNWVSETLRVSVIDSRIFSKEGVSLGSGYEIGMIW